MSSCFFKQNEDKNSKFTKSLTPTSLREKPWGRGWPNTEGFFLAVFMNLYSLSLLLATLARFCKFKL